jgi:hypothetical protein
MCFFFFFFFLPLFIFFVGYLDCFCILFWDVHLEIAYLILGTLLFVFYCNLFGCQLHCLLLIVISYNLYIIKAMHGSKKSSF